MTVAFACCMSLMCKVSEPLWMSKVSFYALNLMAIFFLLDTENIRFVFAAVKDTILQSNLKEYNLVWTTIIILVVTKIHQKKNASLTRINWATIEMIRGDETKKKKVPSRKKNKQTNHIQHTQTHTHTQHKSERKVW